MSGPIVLVGSGDLNRRVAALLRRDGRRVRLVSRHLPAGVADETSAGSITDPSQVAAGVADAIVVVSQIYITRPDALPEAGAVIAARGRAEQALRASGRRYAIVRPSWLTDVRPGQRSIRLEQGDAGDGQISRQDVAELIIAALDRAGAPGLTFEAYNAPGPPPADLGALLDRLQLDQPARG